MIKLIYHSFLLFSICIVSPAFSQEGVSPKTNSNSLNNKNVPVLEESEKNESKSSPSLEKSKASNVKSFQQKDAKSVQSSESSEAQFESYESQSNYMRTQRTPSESQQTKMNEAVKNLELNAPESFEFNIYKYKAGNHNTDLVNYLIKAEKLKPNDVNVQQQMAAYQLITGSESTKYLLLLQNSGKISKEAIAYSHDVLESVAQNGTLITHGFEDTYANNLVKLNSNVRKDVTIISLELLQSETYRKNLKSKGYKIPTDKLIDVSFLVDFCKLNESKQLSIAMTTPKEYLQPLKNQLYAKGLVFEYHTKEFNNYYMNDLLWNKVLDKSIVQNFSSESAKKLSANYLPMLFALRKNYQAVGETEQLEKVDLLIDKIARNINKYEQVQKLKGSY